ncbi:primosomal protein N' [Vagococcus xieshaowenii]|uniref:Replication restart protein PriA n=1 Tax=Vagococcus xieshaowenii TaxID=2562451 RepID=A0A4Z0D0M5_9ENTE|nr:primosomal protein N' [Vagococcus xieshaowenii]QCA29607.1 primosomal protein N' [Vagococcus xieshaowenii]TFZ39270.1 primosomal protein N' [Vagococcus xieshaowenii]
MRKVAEVIVDVPTMQTDLPYTYLIPDELEDKILPGMRVIVPFGKGNRKIQGFVTAINEILPTEDLTALKQIEAPMDLVPVLSKELLEMAEEMRRTTLAFKITCFQTMLPNVMKASYDKKLVVRSDCPQEIMDTVFDGLAEMTWEDAQTSGKLPTIMKLRQENLVDVVYLVNKKNRVKTIKGFQSLLTSQELMAVKDSLKPNAKQQHLLIDVLLLLDGSMISNKEAQELYDISTAVIKTGQTKGWLNIIEQEVKRDPYANHTFKQTFAATLNSEQQLAYEAITHAVREQKSETFLLEGITGSGKTEVYLQVIADVLKENKTGIVLVPEISLTPQTVRRFKERFGSEVAVLHSALSVGEKYDEWRKIEHGDAKVVVGARSAIFAPLDNLGVIIIDEEHESTYKQEENPRYHARDLAIWRANYHQCPVVLGSATPSLETRARAQKKVYHMLQLTERATQASRLPKTEIINMTEAETFGKMQTFSRHLLEKIQLRLHKKEQVVLMLNRRGYSSFVMCRDCGFVVPCPNCDISLTLHMDSHSMKCHYCGHEEPIPNKCPDCQSNKIRYYGTGTQKVEEELTQLFPKARILRMDVDTTRKKGAHERLLEQFGQHEADILLGTQMIAKGLDFPNVTLVGVLNADTALNLPDFRASERTFQLLTQVSGRAGRGDKAGEVVIQTFNPDHYAIQLAKRHDYEQFFRYEMSVRHEANYPPYYFTAQIIASHPEENVVAKKMYDILLGLKEQLSAQAIILGPTPKAVMRVNNRYFYQIVIKYKAEPHLYEYLRSILENNQTEISKGLKLSVDTEPLNFV